MVNHLPEEDGQQGFDPEDPHFFKIILDKCGKLVIPKRFMRMYGENLSSVVLVKVPSGDVWKMQLQRCNDSAFLDKGWKNFVSFYSLELGHLLMFRYELGSSEFQVVIFDKTTTEIKYPLVGKSARTVLPSIRIETSSDDDRGVIGEDKSPDQLQPRTKISMCESPSLLRPEPPKKMKMIHTNNASCLNLEKALDRGNRDGKKMKHQPTVCSVGAAERAAALLRAKSFRSNNPYFKVVMQPSYVYFSYKLYLPGEFMRTHMSEKSGVAKLCISNGRTWSVRYHIGVYGTKVKARMFHGWKAFAEENKLVVGDVCAFELIRDAREVSFKVTIFKAPEATNSRCSPDLPGSIKKSRKIACNRHGVDNNKQKLAGRNHPRACQIPSSAFVSKYPFFQVVISGSYLSHRLLHVPVSFAKKHFNFQLKEQILILEVSGGSWPVKLRNYPQVRSATMCSGVSAFMKENSLKVGDLCTFELIDRKQMVFRVSILRDISLGTVKEE